MPGIDLFIADLRSVFVVLVITAKVISGLVSAALFTGIFILFRKTTFWEDIRGRWQYFKPPQASQGTQQGAESKGHIAQRWEAIQSRMAEGDDINYQFAIIEADKLVDTILQQRGYEGSSMGERLKQLDNETFPRLEQLWYVHKIRNEIVHSTEYHIARTDAEEVMNTYERILRDLEAL